MRGIKPEKDVSYEKDNDLIRSLITCDGRGEAYKQKCLNELLKRERNKVIIELAEETRKLLE
jgi:hypothetical protein